MKTIQLKFKTLLILLLVSFAFASCSSDDSVNNQALNSFNLIEVADGATDVGLRPQLTWEAATDPDGDNVTYQVYLDTQNPPRISIASSLGVSTFSLEDEIQPETIYYWKVVAKDSNGNSTESSAASFTSREMNNAEAIIGKWYLESLEGEASLTACQKNSFYLFSEDSSFLVKRYDVNNDSDCILQDANSGTYTVNSNNQLIIVLNNQSETFQIISLTNEELVLRQDGTTVNLIKE